MTHLRNIDIYLYIALDHQILFLYVYQAICFLNPAFSFAEIFTASGWSMELLIMSPIACYLLNVMESIIERHRT